MLKKLDLVYIAGFFDGEGSIGITNKYYLQVNISNTEKSIIEWLYQNFGGSIKKLEYYDEAKKPLFTICLGGNKAKAFLEQIKPYLKLKKRQANLAVKFQILKESHQFTSIELRQWTKKVNQLSHHKTLSHSQLYFKFPVNQPEQKTFLK